MSNLRTQHILMSQSYLCVAKRNSTIALIISLNLHFHCEWKCRLSFLPGDPIILAATKSGCIYKIWNI